jgi:hypothetical protein
VVHQSYFDNRFSDHRVGVHRSGIRGGLLNWAYRALPPGLRTGITITAQRDDAPSTTQE